MDTFTFGSLCHEASRLLAIADPDELAREGQVTLDGVEVGLVFDEEDTSRLFCYVDIGSAAHLASTPDESSVYRDMLTLNLLRGSKADGVIALDPDSNHLALSAHLTDPDSFDGTRLAATLKEHVENSRLARELLDRRNAANSLGVDVFHLSSLA